MGLSVINIYIFLLLVNVSSRYTHRVVWLQNKLRGEGSRSVLYTREVKYIQCTLPKIKEVIILLVGFNMYVM